MNLFKILKGPCWTIKTFWSEEKVIDGICNEIKDKRILILGFGREGMSTYKFIRKCFPEKIIGIYDKNDILQSKLSNVKLHVGELNKKLLFEYDVIFKTPGIVLGMNDPDILCKITSQTDLFLKYYGRQTTGITGTKGKSTTSSLLYHVLNCAGRDVCLVGNIGIPAFDQLEKINEETMIVYELSSHQLEYVKHSPHVGIILNLFEEHLDHYGTFERYKYAKENIYRYQSKEDILIYNPEFLQPDKKSNSRAITISNNMHAEVFIRRNEIIYKDQIISLPEDEIPLKGVHNAYNIGAVYIMSKILGVPEKFFFEGIKTFQPLPHRMEFVCELGGVKYYNDSISTICEATVQAINSLKNVGTVILGGMDRGISYEPLVNFLNESHVQVIILMPDTGIRIRQLIEDKNSDLFNSKKIITATNLEEAVKYAKDMTEQGKICLFSPAAASYGFFKNFEERGNRFKELVCSR